MRIPLLKKLDAIVGPVLCRLLPGPNADPETMVPETILLIRPGGIGDAALLAPAIRALRSHYPGCRIDVLAERRNAGAFALCPGVDEVLLYDRPAQLMQVLRRRYDVVIDTEQWHRLSAVVARLVRASVRIGFGTNERGRLFAHAVDYAHDWYEADAFLRLLRPLGIDKESAAAPFLQVPAEADRAATSLLAPLDARDFVVLFPGASIAERRWPVEKFRAVAQKLLAQELAVVVVGGGEDVEAGERICAGLDDALNLAGRTSLAGTAAVLRRCRLLVTGDSGVLHIAAGLNVPTVSLFGPGIAVKWAPRGENHRVVNLDFDCSPCTRFGTTPPCPYGGGCIGDITAEQVFEPVAELLDWLDSSPGRS
ncbi:MAG: glycosyltransferase family 9 protein [Geothermobacteraceae bacterium]